MSRIQAPLGFQILGTLGQGAESTVYRARKDGREYVVKMFGDLSGSEGDLEAYSQRVRAQEAGIFPVSLIYHGARLAGLYYSYVPLFGVPAVAYRRSQSLRQALLSQYCFTQAHLMKQHAMEMVDGAQFLLAEDGQFYYVDYGSCIVTADNDWCRTRGYTVFSFLRALFDPVGIVLDAAVRQPGFDYSRPCEFVQLDQYETLRRSSPWTAPIVERIRQTEAGVFLDPDFYAWIAGLTERVVPHAKWLVAPDKLRRAIAGTL